LAPNPTDLVILGGLLVKKPPDNVSNLTLLRAVKRVQRTLQRTLDDKPPPSPGAQIYNDSISEPRKPWAAAPLSARNKGPR
jgi:hypothetical protein